MQRFRTILEAKKYLRLVEGEGLRIGLVPTMGALHDGHLSLVQLARKHAEVVVASIFVNPTQFGPNEDFSRYPRDLDGDAAKLGSAGCDAIFAPDVAEIYPGDFETSVEVMKTSLGLCGAVRPGHFKGVATVVLKLLNIIHPHVAVFGEKDFQQLSVIRRIVRDLSLDVEIVGAPLIREPDGLAMSSRNAYLTADDRTRALAISRGLLKAKAAYDGGTRSERELLMPAEAELRSAGLTPEYLELRDFETLSPVKSADRPAVILTATRVGATRLLDNMILARP